MKTARAAVGERDHPAAVEDAFDEPPFTRNPRTYPIDGTRPQNRDRSYCPIKKPTLKRYLSR
jgi:hypothetical protein